MVSRHPPLREAIIIVLKLKAPTSIIPPRAAIGSIDPSRLIGRPLARARGVATGHTVLAKADAGHVRGMAAWRVGFDPICQCGPIAGEL